MIETKQKDDLYDPIGRALVFDRTKKDEHGNFVKNDKDEYVKEKVPVSLYMKKLKKTGTMIAEIKLPDNSFVSGYFNETKKCKCGKLIYSNEYDFCGECTKQALKQTK